MQVIPQGMEIPFALVALFWMGLVSYFVRRGNIDPMKLLAFNIWVTALCGSALTILRRVEPGGLSTTVLMGGTAIIMFTFLATALAGGGKGAPNKGLVIITLALTAVEVYFLSAHSAGIAASIPEVLALTFLPGIVIQIRNSGASRERLLRLSAYVTTFVVYGSVILGFVAPALAYSQGFADHRRIDILGLTWRLGGFTPHPNFLSVTALMCIVLVLALKLRFRGVTAIVCLLAIGLAESRNAMVTLVVVAAVAWVCKGKTFALRASVATPLSVALVMASGSLESDATALTSDIATNGRFRIWDLVVENFNNDPLNGFGPLAFQPESGSPMLAAGLLHAHNQILQGIAEGGVLGGALTVALLFALLRIGIKHRREVIYPSMVVIFLLSVPTEPFLTLHLYGLNYAVLPAFLMFVVLMSADARSDSPEPVSVVEEERRLSLPDHLANPSASTLRALGLVDAHDQPGARH